MAATFSADQACKPPFHAVKVTGALFHTQGGLAIDSKGRVKRKDGAGFPNLFAAGGAAAGVSGSTAAGYLSGNGLLTATVLGRLTGESCGGANTALMRRFAALGQHASFLQGAGSSAG